MKNYALCGPPRLLVPPCKNDIHKNSKMTLLHAFRYGLPTIGIVIVLIVLTIIYRRCQSRGTTLPIRDDLLSLKTLRRISYYELSQATNGFEECNMLGFGSFGYVYKGRLSDGMEVAIKVFNLQIEGAFQSFDIECDAMRNIVHRNIVKVINCCSSVDFKALVFDYMSNGNLEKWLHSNNCFLDIIQRVNIMIDVAAAVEHLHNEHPTPIIHCDLKPSNILLDEDMVAHVGDFGIAKLLGEGDVMKQTMTLATIGYMAPGEFFYFCMIIFLICILYFCFMRLWIYI
ncbi:receptor kinase-like protein Xa21 [Gossypium raimondii]|uniref:receptor kinase-like protein Xa21 n=1 Tax=Gossypium raimondii TaxID=29730 RepID=UPI00227CF3BC|nr:receptor kinase-like protein Xa21 [Gossypium raimondii]